MKQASKELDEKIDKRLNQIINKALKQEEWKPKLFDFALTAKEMEIFYYLSSYFKSGRDEEIKINVLMNGKYKCYDDGYRTDNVVLRHEDGKIR